MLLHAKHRPIIVVSVPASCPKVTARFSCTCCLDHHAARAHVAREYRVKFNGATDDQRENACAPTSPQPTRWLRHATCVQFSARNGACIMDGERNAGFWDIASHFTLIIDRRLSSSSSWLPLPHRCARSRPLKTIPHTDRCVRRVAREASLRRPHTHSANFLIIPWQTDHWHYVCVDFTDAWAKRVDTLQHYHYAIFMLYYTYIFAYILSYKWTRDSVAKMCSATLAFRLSLSLSPSHSRHKLFRIAAPAAQHNRAIHSHHVVARPRL